jgi:predicted component of type VI protein secretion system
MSKGRDKGKPLLSQGSIWGVIAWGSPVGKEVWRNIQKIDQNMGSHVDG